MFLNVKVQIIETIESIKSGIKITHFYFYLGDLENGLCNSGFTTVEFDALFKTKQRIMQFS
jgi:hypothetical protein